MQGKKKVSDPRVSSIPRETHYYSMIDKTVDREVINLED